MKTNAALPDPNSHRTQRRQEIGEKLAAGRMSPGEAERQLQRMERHTNPVAWSELRRKMIQLMRRQQSGKMPLDKYDEAFNILARRVLDAGHNLSRLLDEADEAARTPVQGPESKV